MGFILCSSPGETNCFCPEHHNVSLTNSLALSEQIRTWLADSRTGGSVAMIFLLFQATNQARGASRRNLLGFSPGQDRASCNSSTITQL